MYIPYVRHCNARILLTNTDTFFSWVPVRRSVTGILKFVAHFWFESVLQCSNFLHWCATMFEFSALLYVYRHANLCSGLRAILSPQLIKKKFAILSILPRMWHRSDSNPQSSRTMSIIQIGRSTDYAMGQWWKLWLLWFYLI